MTLGSLLHRLALGLALAAAGAAAFADDAPVPPAPADAASAPRQVLVMLRSPPAHARVDGSYGGAGYADAARAQAQQRAGARLAAAHGLTLVTLWAMPSLGLDCAVFALPLGQPAATAQFLWDVGDGKARPDTASDWWNGIVHGDMHAH